MAVMHFTLGVLLMASFSVVSHCLLLEDVDKEMEELGCTMQDFGYVRDELQEALGTQLHQLIADKYSAKEMNLVLCHLKQCGDDPKVITKDPHQCMLNITKDILRKRHVNEELAQSILRNVYGN